MKEQNVRVIPYNQNSPKQEEIQESEAGIQFHLYLYILFKHKLILIVSLAIALCAAYLVNTFQEPRYEASTELVIEQKKSDADEQNSNPSAFLRDPTFMLTQERLIKSRKLADKVISSFKGEFSRAEILGNYGIGNTGGAALGDKFFSDSEKESLVSSLLKSIQLRPVASGARILKLSAEGPNPQIVSFVANRAANAYLEINQELRIDSFQENFKLISTSLEEVREKIKVAELASQKIDKELTLLKSLNIYGERHPTIVTLRDEISAFVKEIELGNRELEKMELGQRTELVRLIMEPHLNKGILESLESDIKSVKPILQQEINTNREMYESLFKKLQEVEVSGSGSFWIDGKVLKKAGLPSGPVSPNKPLNYILAILVGLVIGVSLVFFKEYMDSTLSSVEDVKSYLKLNPLGIVPFVSFEDDEFNKAAKLAARGEGSRPFWNTKDQDIPLFIEEAYRIIRTNIAFGGIIETGKVIQITSAVKGEGKTTTGANLAISFAQAGFNTLLIDADMRKPSVHRILKIDENTKGLSDLISEHGNWEAFVEPSRIKNLSCIVAGAIPENPAELLSSKLFEKLVSDVKSHYDIVLIDTPPVVSVADAPIVASRTDGTILIARAGFIPRQLYRQAKNSLISVHANIIGCVLNGVTREHHPYYYNYYGYNRYYDDYSPYGYGSYGNEKKVTKKNVFQSFLSQFKKNDSSTRYANQSENDFPSQQY